MKKSRNTNIIVILVISIISAITSGLASYTISDLFIKADMVWAAPLVSIMFVWMWGHVLGMDAWVINDMIAYKRRSKELRKKLEEEKNNEL